MSFVALIGLVGVTLIISRGTIFAWLQRRVAAVKCPQCVGMWVGIAGGAYGLVQTGYGRIIDAFIVGGATSFLALLFGVILSVLDEL